MSLTKNDLQAISGIVEDKLKPINTRLDIIEDKVKPIKRMATNIRSIRKDLNNLIRRDDENDVFLQRRV